MLEKVLLSIFPALSCAVGNRVAGLIGEMGAGFPVSPMGWQKQKDKDSGMALLLIVESVGEAGEKLELEKRSGGSFLSGNFSFAVPRLPHTFHTKTAKQHKTLSVFWIEELDEYKIFSNTNNRTQVLLPVLLRLPLFSSGVFSY